MNQHERDQRAAKALELHLAGASYAAITKSLGFASKSGAHRAVQAALAAGRSATAPAVPVAPDETVQVGLARLDALLGALWAKARRGDVAAVDRVLKIEERRVALLSLSAQTASAVPAADGLDELKARRDRKRDGR